MARRTVRFGADDVCPKGTSQSSFADLVSRVVTIVRESALAGRLVRAPGARHIYQVIRPPLARQITTYVRRGSQLLEQHDLSDVTITKSGAFFRSPWGAEFGFVPFWGAYGTEAGILHEETELKFCSDALPPGGVLIDVGANVGVYSVNLAYRRHDIFCVAFEPVSASFEWLRGNVRRNGLESRVQTICKAVGRSGGGHGRITDGQFSGNHLIPAGGIARGTQATEIVSLDEWAATAGPPKVSLIKIDVEGAEFDAIIGARGLITRDKPILMVEVFAEHAQRFGRSAADVYDIFRELNYERRPSPSGFESHNWIFAPKNCVS